MCGEASTAEVESWALTIREVCNWHFRDEMFKRQGTVTGLRGLRFLIEELRPPRNVFDQR
jgi:hypothetical protein